MWRSVLQALGLVLGVTQMPWRHFVRLIRCGPRMWRSMLQALGLVLGVTQMPWRQFVRLMKVPPAGRGRSKATGSWSRCAAVHATA